MVQRKFSASLSRSQGREGWTAIFRHPVRPDKATGKPGLRVRRGLGTKSEDEARRVRHRRLNEILSDPELWQSSARSRAEARFNPRVVDIFYADLVPEPVNSFDVRGSVMPLPERNGSDVSVLLLGTTGSGKTTLVRQLLGTDPKTERFPSTSAGKTTTADTEFIIDDGPYRAAVTFRDRDEVRDYLEECMTAAALAAYRRKQKVTGEILRRLLNHVSQRFRLNYILGNGPSEPDDEDFEGEEEAGELVAGPTLIDLDVTVRLLAKAVNILSETAKEEAAKLTAELGAGQDDERVVKEIFGEENLDHVLSGERRRFSGVGGRLNGRD